MYRHELDGGTCIVNPGAALTLDAPHQFKAFVNDLLEKEQVDRLIVNFEALTRIDSFGIGVIVGLFKTIQAQDKRFAITNMSESHRKLFVATGLDRVIDIFATNADAIAAMRA